MSVRAWAIDTFAASSAYVAASFLTFAVLMPLQNMYFPEYPSRASLLFLPHGVRVLSAWLLGWRAIFALLPGVFIVFAYLGGTDVFLPSRLLAIAIAVTTVPAVFYLCKAVGWDLFPRPDRKPCWACVMGVGIITSFLVSGLTNLAFGSATVEYIAFLIGDISGLFFLMLGLYFAFRFADKRRG
ncbi:MULTISPECIES: hypothetical protein [unclassified Ruegeria]|uniref:hypothetical protein n=1 Tax=unclassified Ruegeria TaxID=2625375 RepID=UPI0014886A99|nr:MULTISPECIES: hypothetical protein [unclassified Ruegeria]NOD65288.1 hypothetical protein [Ruegeria sp. HKCCD6109]NOD94950.1 hypothetical protein [Ruegeria sp. HKCCD4884]